jgi:hypothetical protein
MGDPIMTRLRDCVQASPASAPAILALIEAQRADGHLYDADYALRAVAAAIKARKQQT